MWGCKWPKPGWRPWGGLCYDQGQFLPEARAVGNGTMGSGRIGVAAVLAAGLMVGCRIAGREGPASRSLVTSRQLSQQGVAALERGQWDRADELLGQAVRACPSNVDARRHYAEARWNCGRHQEALAELEAAQRLAPEDASLAARIAEMRLAMGQTSAALDAAQRAIDLDPKQAAGWAVRARIWRAQRDWNQALADYQRALSCSPDDSRLPCEIAAVYLELHKPHRALASVQEIIDRCAPGEEPQEALVCQGLSYLALGRYEEAAESLSGAAARGRPTADILFHLAQAQWGAGRLGQALAAAEQAVALDPNHQPARILLEQTRLAAQPNDLPRR